MSVISTVEAVPGRLRIIFAYLADKGAMGERSEVLSSLIAPVGLGRREESQLYPSTLAAAKALGLLVEQDGRVALVDCPTKAELEYRGSDALFRERIELLLLGSTAIRDSEYGVVARALAWLLMQSPYTPLDFSVNQKGQLQKQLDSDGSVYGLGNTSSFQNLVYWARYLGYCDLVGLRKGTSVVPNPTRAILALLDKVLPRGTRLTIQTFLNALAHCTPVLEGGEVRAEVEARSKVVRGPQELSPATSLALARLNKSQHIKLDSLSDADVYILDLGDETARLTHVSRL